MQTSLSPEQISRALRMQPPTPTKTQTATFQYSADLDELLEAKDFRRLASELEDAGQLPSYVRHLRSALRLVIRDSPYDEDIPLLKGVALYTRSSTLRQQALHSLQLFLVDCSGDRDAALKADIQKLLQKLEKERDEPRI
ncbi:MAG: hypothetical protein BGO25_02685 [Acidobacteriales bacterium 59-55]|nr:hypothetical protein [Terriglobales bacterium]OJV42426.1 MAG: hypothetical protein BGO25_02685 [Acidobacteriales bacterium 59-55]